MEVEKKALIVSIVIGLIAILGVIVVTLLVLLKRRRRKRRRKKKKKKRLEKEYGFILMLNLMVFTYRELQLARRALICYFGNEVWILDLGFKV